MIFLKMYKDMIDPAQPRPARLVAGAYLLASVVVGLFTIFCFYRALVINVSIYGFWVGILVPTVAAIVVLLIAKKTIR